MKFFKHLMTVISISILLVSCSKLNSSLQDLRISQDNADIASKSDDIKSMVDQAIETNKIGDLKREDVGALLGGSVIITKDSSKLPNVSITIDFGTGYTSNRGKVYTGKINVFTNGKSYKETGYNSSITFKDFTVDGDAIDNASTNQITNLGPKDAQMTWTGNMNFIVVKKLNSKKITAIGTLTKKQTAGIETPQFSDDVFEGTGEVNGTSEDVAYTFNITTPLLRRMDCGYISKGVITYTKNTDQGNKTMDFGDGTCDNKAVLTIEGVKTDMTVK